MKKIISIFIFVVICLTTRSLASNQVEMVEMQIYRTSGNKISGSFVMENKDNIYYPDLYYSLTLVPTELYNKTHYSSVSAYYNSFGPFSLGQYENKLVAFEFEVPEYIPYQEYVLELKVENGVWEIASPIWIDNVKIGNKDVNEFLMPNVENSHYYKIKNYENPLSGPYRDAGDPATVYMKVNSRFEKSIKVKPQITFYKRSNMYDEKTYRQYGEEITIKPKEDKEIAIKLPDVNVPESYYYLISLVDENNMPVSYEYHFRCVINGATAKIAKINTHYDDYSKKLYVDVAYMGSPDGSIIKNVQFTNTLYETDSNKVLADYGNKIDLNSISSKIVYGTEMPKSGTKVTIFSSLMTEDGKMLSSKRVDLPSEATSAPKDNFIDTVGTQYELAVKMLNSYGIISGYPDGTFKPEKTLSRAELTSIALNMLGIDISDYEVQDGYFTDVPKNHWAYKTINYAYESGIVNGYGDALFKPNNEVKFSEAITILLNTIGYKEEVEEIITPWPNNYISIAKEYAIDVGTDIEDFSTPANRGKIAVLALNSYVMRKD